MTEEARLHAATIGMGIDFCQNDPPCCPPTMRIEVVAYATAGGRHWEVHTTFREMP